MEEETKPEPDEGPSKMLLGLLPGIERNEEPEAKEDANVKTAVLIPVVQGYPLPDEEDELIVLESLNHNTNNDVVESVEEEDEEFVWSVRATLGELFKAFPQFGKGKKALKVVGDELIFI